MKKKPTHNCCICGRIFKGHGNNPWPIKETGVCCDMCNKKVIDARIVQATDIK